jgi:hypothetical protein
MQVLSVIAEQCGTFALVVVTIERYSNRSSALWKVLFVVILFSELFWGLISGVKSSVFQNFLVVALVSSVIQRRLNLRWLILPAFGLVLFYPFSNAYRGLVRGRGHQVTSLQGAGGAGQMAFKGATQEAANSGGLWGAGLKSLVSRVDLLTSVAQVLTLGPRASMVRGHVEWWMLPIYPFVPRLLWPSKPILDEGGWFTVALGGARHGSSGIFAGSSTAVTYPGDLYLQFGLLGIPVGMFVLGVVAQLLANRVSGLIEGRDLFVYAGIFLYGFPIEGDVFGLWTTLIKFLAILYVLRWVLYGPRRRVSGASRSARRE